MPFYPKKGIFLDLIYFALGGQGCHNVTASIMKSFSTQIPKIPFPVLQKGLDG